MPTIKAFITRHPVPAYFALTFAISWGGALLAIGESGGMRGTTPPSDRVHVRMAELVKYAGSFSDRFPTNDEIEAIDSKRDRNLQARPRR
jgi:hypothetical protein